MDTLDLILTGDAPLAIEHHYPDGLTRIRYYDGPRDRGDVVRALAQARRSHHWVTDVVDLAWLAEPKLGDRGWCPLPGL